MSYPGLGEQFNSYQEFKKEMDIPVTQASTLHSTTLIDDPPEMSIILLSASDRDPQLHFTGLEGLSK
ncbi:hypothetical protein MXB_3735, partial [Myxobolus squamalis]